MKAILFNSKGAPSLHKVDINLINERRSEESLNLWIDVDGKENVDNQFFESQFNLSPLSLLDSTRARHPPKYESFDDNTFVLLRSIDPTETRNTVKFSQ